MRGELTFAEKQILRDVAAHQPTTVREVTRRVGYGSTQTVHAYIQRLRGWGLLAMHRTETGVSVSRGLMLGPDVVISESGQLGRIIWMRTVDGRIVDEEVLNVPVTHAVPPRRGGGVAQL